MNQLETINNFLNNHSVKELFIVRIQDYSAGKLTLGFKTRDTICHQGAIGSVIDCMARIVGLTLIGECSISEYEINFHIPEFSDSFIATAEISSSNQQYASYYCAIHNWGPKSRLIAESQGTLFIQEPCVSLKVM
jgi:hypothetical protein